MQSVGSVHEITSEKWPTSFQPANHNILHLIKNGTTVLTRASALKQRRTGRFLGKQLLLLLLLLPTPQGDGTTNGTSQSLECVELTKKRRNHITAQSMVHYGASNHCLKEGYQKNRVYPSTCHVHRKQSDLATCTKERKT